MSKLGREATQLCRENHTPHTSSEFISWPDLGGGAGGGQRRSRRLPGGTSDGAGDHLAGISGGPLELQCEILQKMMQ